MFIMFIAVVTAMPLTAAIAARRAPVGNRNTYLAPSHHLEEGFAGGCKVIVDTAAGGTLGQPPLWRLFRPFLKVGSLYGAINCLVAPTCGCK